MPTVIEKPTTKKTHTLTLGAASDKVWQLREDKRALEKEVAAIESEIKTLTETIFGMLDEQDTRKAEGKKASISVNYTEVGNVTDWDAFWPWVAKTKNFHLIQKRVSDPGLREQWALGKKTPGVVPFTKRSLSVTSL